jgi:hypothetical protein
VFQQHTLICWQWHDDFLAINIEGGLPSSESAGVMAFMHKHLFDSDEDTRATKGKEDLEAQDVLSLRHGV